MNVYAVIIVGQQKKTGIMHVSFKGKNMLLTCHFLSEIKSNINIDLTQIKNIFETEILGSTQFSFYYNDTQFIFFEYGLGVTNFLQKNFKEKTISN